VARAAKRQNKELNAVVAEQQLCRAIGGMLREWICLVQWWLVWGGYMQAGIFCYGVGDAVALVLSGFDNTTGSRKVSALACTANDEWAIYV
jgi:hypothetical protein